MTTHLVWFRNDLRIADNKALHAACCDPHAKVLAVFIATPKQWQLHGMAPRQAAFIYASLKHVQHALAQKGIPLYCHQCDYFSTAIDWLIDYCSRKKVEVLFYNKQYEINEVQRDQKVEQRLFGRVRCEHFDDSLLLPPRSVHTRNGDMYKVYTEFRRAFICRLTESDIHCQAEPRPRDNTLITLKKPLAFAYPLAEIGDLFPVGEQVALQRLRTFCCKSVQSYLVQRDLPAIYGTSSLSVYLAIGALSPRQCFNRLRIEYPSVLEDNKSGAFGWLNELIWREFYRHLIVAYPKLCKYRPFIEWTDNILWENDESLLQTWQSGKTGYPIVDAAMRQLNHTGWMNNRLRMISASFLVKNLLIDWRAGERYFMSQLLDGDLAANNGGWQWVASTGTDLAPYFRIFNPTVQSKRYDPSGGFIRKWLPELKSVPENNIHHPHLWAQKRHIILNYPKPIVEYRQSRIKTLAAFKNAKRKEF